MEINVSQVKYDYGKLKVNAPNMMNKEGDVIYIPGRFKSAVKDGYVTGTEDIIDDNKGKSQDVINAEVDDAFAMQQSLINALSNLNYVTVSTYASLPLTGAVDTIYRVSNWDGSANNGAGSVSAAAYSEYSWDNVNNEYKLLDVKTQIGEVFDVSLYNAVGGVLATYADLSAALGVDGANIPSGVRKGGMSVKYVQIPDHKYVQYFLTKDEWSVSEADWEKMNLEKEVSQLGIKLIEPQWITGYYINKDDGLPRENADWEISREFPVFPNVEIYLNGTGSGSAIAVVSFKDKDGQFISSITASTFNNYQVVPPSGAFTMQFCKAISDNLIVDINKMEYQEQFNLFIENQITNIEQEVRIIDLPISWVDGEFCRPDGSFGVQSLYCRTNFVDIGTITPLYLSGVFFGSSIAAICFYDSEYTPISNVLPETYADYLLTIPVTAKYAVVCCQIERKSSVHLFVKTGVSAVLNGLVTEQLIPIKIDWHPNNYLRKTTGVITAYFNSSYKISQKIPIIPQKKYYISTTTLNNPSLAATIVYYDASGNYVGELGNSIYTLQQLNIPENTTYMVVGMFEENKPTIIFTDDELANSNNSGEYDYTLAQKISQGGVVYLDPVNYRVEQTINLPNGTTIVGSAGTVITRGATDKIFNIENKEKIVIRSITFVGGASITAGSPDSTTNPSVMAVSEIRSRSLEGSNVGIYATGNEHDCVIEDCNFTGFDLAGIRIYRSHGDHHRHIKIVNCDFYGNWYGLLLDVRAEFNAISNCSFNNNKVGAFVAGGNNLFANCHLDQNEVGFCVCSTLGENADHGSISNCTYNHNTVYGVACVDVGSGFIFTSANMYQGDLMLDNSEGVQIVNSVLAVTIINQRTNVPSVVPNRSGVNLITNNLFHDTYMSDPTTPITDYSRLILKNNYWYWDGSDTNLVN